MLYGVILFRGSVSAGIPNITGATGVRVPYGDSATYGAFYYHYDYTSCYGYVGGATGATNPYLEASRCSEVYGNSSTVTPLSRSCKFFIRY